MASRNAKIIIAVVVVIIIIAAGVSVALLYHPPKKAVTHVFTDTSQTAAPEELDPATGFFTTNGPLFAAVFQTLVEFNGTSTQVVPVLAQHIYNHNDQNYTFDIWSFAKFSNNKSLNATSVWFSFYRGIVMGQGPYASDYPGILFNGTNEGITGISLPWGLRAALVNAGYTLTGNLTQQYKQAATDLDNILSNFNYNSTEMKVMEYKDQAIVVNSNDNVTINTMAPYPFLLQDIAGWWGDILYPGYVDAHGGVKYNTPNSYIDDHGAIGSGPYIIKSVSSGLSTIVLEKNPNYWVLGHTSQIPSIAQPAHIPEIVIKYGLSHTDRLEDFDHNTSQISEVGPSSFKQIISGFYDKSKANGNLVKAYKVLGAFYISMNMERSYTKNLHFRMALYNALNYTDEMTIYNNNYNNTAEAYLELGPLSPQYGKSYYNPDNYPLPSQNLKAAIQNLTIAGDECHFYVTLPNGTKIGDKSGTDLSSHTFTITGIAPATTLETEQTTIAIDSFAKVGLHFTAAYVTESEVADWTTPSSTPHFVDLGWLPDYPDPIGQQLIPIYDKSEGGTFGGNDAWVENATLQKYFSYLDFVNATTQIKDMKTVQKIVYDQYAYMWLPMPYTYYFVQPYVHNFVYNPFIGYFYNLMYISYNGSSGSSYSAHNINYSELSMQNLIAGNMIAVSTKFF